MVGRVQAGSVWLVAGLVAAGSLAAAPRPAVLAGAGQAAGAPGAQAPAYVTYEFDAPRALELDPTRIAVFGTGLRDVRGADIGLDGAPVRRLPLLEARLVELPAGDRTRAGVERALDASATLRAESVAYTAPVFIGADGGPLVPTRAILVRFDETADPAACEGVLKAFGTVAERDWGGMPNAYRVVPDTRDGRDVLNWAAELARRGDTVFAEADMLFTGSSSLVPNDPLFLSSWGLNNIGQNVGGIGFVDIDMNVAQAWDSTLGSTSMLTMIIDQGVQQNHPDLNQIPGMDFTTDNGVNGGPVNGCDSHGTAMAGVVSAKINNALGSAGVAPATKTVSARAMISDVPCNGEWFSVSSWTVNALAWAESLGVRVTNNSNRYGFTATSITNKYFLTKNGSASFDPMVHFAAAGNSGDPVVDYPASLPSVNAISAVDNRGRRVGFSNHGPQLFMTGPGLDVRTTDRTGFDGFDSTDYALLDGTSLASPMVAGVAALVLSVNPDLTSVEVETILKDTARDYGDPGFDEDFGWGMPDAAAAIAAAIAEPPCPPDCDDNGSLNFDDIDCFVTGFLGGDLGVADCDASGSLNFDDIDCFVADFLAGCP